MKVSIVLTTYNGEEYLYDQMESIYHQTYSIDEVIVCDDGSTDKTVNIVEAFIEQKNLSKTWKLHRNEKNLGYADNFFQGMNLSSGKYVFFSDQDDIWMPEKVEEMVKVMDENLGIQLLSCEYEVYTCTEDAPVLSDKILKQMKNDSSVEKLSLNKKTIFIGSEGCTMCVRQSFFEEIKPFWFSGWAHDEYIWKLSLCKNGCYLYHRNLMKRRLHSNNVSKRKMHTLEKRVDFLEKLEKSHSQTYLYGKKIQLSDDLLGLIDKNRKSVALRVDLLTKRHIMNTVPLLLFYISYYSSKKSLLVEGVMSLKGDFRKKREK